MAADGLAINVTMRYSVQFDQDSGNWMVVGSYWLDGKPGGCVYAVCCDEGEARQALERINERLERL